MGHEEKEMLVDIEEDGLSKEILMTIEPTRMWGLIFFR
jgi:hypothetical protein